MIMILMYFVAFLITLLNENVYMGFHFGIIKLLEFQIFDLFTSKLMESREIVILWIHV
jgi:hypothetical protein